VPPEKRRILTLENGLNQRNLSEIEGKRALFVVNSTAEENAWSRLGRDAF
jgi:hypothetical protein